MNQVHKNVIQEIAPNLWLKKIYCEDNQQMAHIELSIISQTSKIVKLQADFHKSEKCTIKKDQASANTSKFAALSPKLIEVSNKMIEIQIEPSESE